MPHCKSILVVDDDRGIREAMELALQMEGYHVETAANGEEALRRLKTIERPCLILLDLMMPIMSGFEFLSMRQKDVLIAPIPVVIISAFPNEAQKVQAQGFVKKPVNLDLLLALVKQYCD